MKVTWGAFTYDFRFTVLMRVTWDAFACVLNASNFLVKKL